MRDGERARESERERERERVMNKGERESGAGCGRGARVAADLGVLKRVDLDLVLEDESWFKMEGWGFNG